MSPETAASAPPRPAASAPRSVEKKSPPATAPPAPVAAPAPSKAVAPRRPNRPASVRWWAWGDLSRRYPKARAERLKDYLQHELGVPPLGAGGPGAVLEAIVVPPSRLDAAELQALRALLPTGVVSESRDERLLHSFGRSYVDLLTMRRGRPSDLTDAVVHPASLLEVENVLRYAAAHDLAVVPWGGGTSVVGGVDPERGSHRAVITLSLTRLCDPVGLDEVSRLAKFQCGIHGPDLERFLNARGFTLGHFPQSFEFSTLGGWLATRSNGQASSRYGEAVERLRGATVATPVGTYRWEHGTTESSGPDPSGLFVGCEGTLGVFVEATMWVDRLPAQSSYRVALFPDWSSGMQACRELSQTAPYPAVLRLSDAQETLLTLEGRPPAETFGDRMRERLEPGYLGFRKLEGGTMCLCVSGYEGTESEVRQGEAQRREALKAHGGTDLGSRAGESWRKERFLLPYLRDDLVEDGWLVETLETGAPWSEVDSVTIAVKEALKQAARRGKFPLMVATHLSHTSPNGTGVYFTLIAPQQPKDPVGQWLALKEAATEALLPAGGVLSHHHGIGRMHRPWVSTYRKSLGGMSLKAVKTTFDPAGILNPGKTLPEETPPFVTAKAAPAGPAASATAAPSVRKEKEKEKEKEKSEPGGSPPASIPGPPKEANPGAPEAPAEDKATKETKKGKDAGKDAKETKEGKGPDDPASRGR